MSDYDYDTEQLPAEDRESDEPTPGATPSTSATWSWASPSPAWSLVWALIVGDVVDDDDIRWLMPIPWVSAGVVGLVAMAAGRPAPPAERVAPRVAGWTCRPWGPSTPNPLDHPHGPARRAGPCGAVRVAARRARSGSPRSTPSSPTPPPAPRPTRCRSRPAPTASWSPASGTGEERVAACVVRADTRADVNNLVKRMLDVRKCSFLSMDRAVEESGMEYGGITPVGLPDHWRLLVDSRVAELDVALIGSGVRRSKLLLPGPLFAELPRAEVVEDLAG